MLLLITHGDKTSLVPVTIAINVDGVGAVRASTQGMFWIGRWARHERYWMEDRMIKWGNGIKSVEDGRSFDIGGDLACGQRSQQMLLSMELTKGKWADVGGVARLSQVILGGDKWIARVTIIQNHHHFACGVSYNRLVRGVHHNRGRTRARRRKEILG